MNTHPAHRKMRLVVILLIALGGAVPVVFYWTVLGRVPSVTADEAKETLSRPGGSAVLVDVRSAERFAESHLEGARNWPYAAIAAMASAEGTPEEFRGKRLLLICDSGITSGLAARRLQELGTADVANVIGGMQAWVGSAERPCGLSFCRLQSASGETSGLPLRDAPLLEQWAAVLTGFVVKPIYTVLALALVVVLWRQKSPDLAALRWGMLFFFVGENCCAANYLLYSDRSYLLEYFHSLGMVVCFGLVIYTLLEGIDRRLVKFSDADARCAALALCRRCIKHADVPCGLKRTFLVMIPALMILCFVPLTAEMTTVSYNTEIFGTLYNYSHPVIGQLFEIRYLPAAAIVLLVAAFGLLRFKRRDPVLWSKVFFSAAAGALGFSFFRLIFVQVFRDHQVWFGVWEETTELLFVASAAVLLWVFRHGLFGRPPGEARPAERGLDAREESAT